VAGSYAYVADRLAGVQVVDVSDATNPFIAATCDVPADARGIDVAGDHALVADVGTGLLAINIADPTAPLYVGGCSVADGGYDVIVTGDYAYMSLGFWGLQVFDISDRRDPVPLDDIETAGWAYGLAASGDYVFVADHDNGVVVAEVRHRRYDLTSNRAYSNVIDESEDPIISGRLTTVENPNVAYSLSADGGAHWQTFFPNGEIQSFAHPGTLLVWRSTLYYGGEQVNPACFNLTFEYFKDETGLPDDSVPATLALRQNTPNPFSSGTTLTYDVPSPGADVRMEVFDVAGRRVAVLLDGEQAPGLRTVTWDGRDSHGRQVATGIYYCRMSADGFEQAVKMMLLR
jgi:hypothetical protein